MNTNCQYKKSVSFVFSVILAFVLFAAPFNNLSSASSGGGGGGSGEVLPTVTLSILSQPAVAVDSDFIASVEISQVTDFDATDYTLLFDPAVLRLDDITPGTIGSTSVPVMFNQTGYGRYIIVQNLPGLAGVSGSGSLAILHFHVLGILGTSSDIFLSNATISNTFANESNPLLVGDHVDVNIIAGDANSDGKVDAVDITKLERIIAGLDNATPGADANQDGKYDALDINEIKRIIAGLSNSSLAPAAALAETKVPDLNLDLYLYVKQANPTVVPADLVGSTTDIDLDSLALWGIVENNDYSIGGALNFCDAADALTGYSLIPAETGLWTMLSGRTIYAVYGSGAPFERLKSAIINNNFKKYVDAQALNEVAALPYTSTNKPIMIGVLKPRPEVIKLIENHIDTDFSRTIDNLTPWAQPQILTLGLYSSQPVSVADIQNRLENGTLWDLNFGVLASVISAGPASVFSATADKYLADNNYEKIKLENITVYRDCVKYIADTTLPALNKRQWESCFRSSRDIRRLCCNFNFRYQNTWLPINY